LRPEPRPLPLYQKFATRRILRWWSRIFVCQKRDDRIDHPSAGRHGPSRDSNAYLFCGLEPGTRKGGTPRPKAASSAKQRPASERTCRQGASCPELSSRRSTSSEAAPTCSISFRAPAKSPFSNDDAIETLRSGFGKLRCEPRKGLRYRIVRILGNGIVAAVEQRTYRCDECVVAGTKRRLPRVRATDENIDF
jgi:hypothetical protein